MSSASSSSSPVMASSTNNSHTYDAFLSFCGEDTRHSFTDHLYHKLVQAGIHTFRDNDAIHKGGELKSEFRRAIEGSRVSIVVLSKNYPTSSWCLEELVLILEQRSECNQFVLPVFYGVEPSDVRKLQGNFAIEVKPSSSVKWTDHNVEKWRMALTVIADLAGEVVSGPETNILKRIVDTIYDKLDCKEVSLPSNIIGMATHDKEINYWLEEDDREFLAIYGMGGSGKTTLAKYIYNSKKKYFEYVSFLEEIDRICKEPNGLLKLQEQLLKDLSGGKRRKIPGVSHGTCKIRDVLQMNRALIVLDDIAEHKQLVDLLGGEVINAKSKIIITTRDSMDNWFDSSCWSCRKYEMKLLNDEESSELLCHHAFRSKIPKVGYEELVLEAIQCCESNPLALEVLGSSLSKCNTILSWKSQLKLFVNDLHSGIEGVLEKSYKSLPYQSERELFLHIACFFVGMDIDYVIKILEPDYSAFSGIKTLISKCLLSVSPNKKLMMHRLIQEMGKNIVRQESFKFPADRSRVWLSRDSFNILRKGRGSKTIEGLALDMNILLKEDFAFKSLELTTDALNYMENLKLLQLNFVKPDGLYDKFSEDLRWLCWHGFHLTTIPSDLFMGNLVALDMSYSNLVVFEPPKGLRSLQILNLKDSHELTEIRKLYMIPNLETLILWNCYRLVNVCEKLEELTSLATLNMTGCSNLFNKEQTNTSLEAVTENLTFSFPCLLHRLFLGGCHLERTHIFPLSFSGQPYLQYLNLVSGQFESLHCFDHLKHLRVLDLSFCSELKFLLSLPSTLAELYVYHCESLERIAFEAHQFTLQEIGYEGCVNLYEVEGFIKLVPIHKLDEADLGHLKWLKEYRNHEMRLVGDELVVGRSVRVQMLYEFGIASTFLPDIKDPNMTPKYKSESNFLSFDVPSCPKNKRLKGINVTFKYSSLDEDWGWFCKINTTNGIDLMYNPKVYGKPEVGEACIWLSYWPIGNTLKTGDRVHVTIVNVSMFKAEECGASLVYSDEETLALETNMGWEEVVGGELSAFQLSTGAYYLCRRDLFEYLEVRSSPFETWESAAQNRDWFRILVGDNIDHTEIRGWRKTGRPKHVNRSFTELKTVRYIMDDPQLEDIYDVANMSKSRHLNKPLRSTFAIVDEVAEAIQSNTFMEGDLLVKKKSEDTFSVKSKSGDTPYPQGENRIVSRENPLQPPLIQPSGNQLSLADFDEVKVIGRGNGGILQLVQHKWSGQFFALKMIQMNVDESARNQIAKELKINQSSQCANIVACYQSFYDNGAVSIIMEYMDGGSLADLLKSGRSIREPYLAAICKQVLKGLWYLHHEKHIIHRDLKPSNLLINHQGEVKITDFGVSAILTSTSGLANTFVGTYNYLSPERIIGGSYSYQSDIWSFGLVLLECATGKFPYSPPQPGDGWVNVYELMETIVYGPPPRAPSDQFSPQFCSFIEACLQKDPKDRASANELMSHPFISMYDDMAVDLASYFTEAGSSLAAS